ncbi:MAG: hypothetical protein LBU90_01020 [Bacteroidales bacterium]|jgi:hypothetical protein|nr:hypothetical protein [Bacteroidales bacterium]
MIQFEHLGRKQLVLLIFEAVMSLFYPIFGVWLFLSNFFQINVIINTVLSALFVLYGIYRLYRTITKIFADESTEN